jgi:hypothetical protein
VAPRLVPIQVISRESPQAGQPDSSEAALQRLSHADGPSAPPAARPGTSRSGPATTGAAGDRLTLFGEPISDDMPPDGSLLRQALGSLPAPPAANSKHAPHGLNTRTPPAALDALARLSVQGPSPQDGSSQGAQAPPAALPRGEPPVGVPITAARSGSPVAMPARPAKPAAPPPGATDGLPASASAAAARVTPAADEEEPSEALRALKRALPTGGASSKSLQSLRELSPQAAAVAAHRAGARADTAAPPLVRDSIARANSGRDRRRSPRANALPEDPAAARPREFSRRTDLILTWTVAVAISAALGLLAWLADLPDLALGSILFIGLAILRTLMGSMRAVGDRAAK